jgi:hypothetical protein
MPIFPKGNTTGLCASARSWRYSMLTTAASDGTSLARESEADASLTAGGGLNRFMPKGCRVNTRSSR